MTPPNTLFEIHACMCSLLLYTASCFFFFVMHLLRSCVVAASRCRRSKRQVPLLRAFLRRHAFCKLDCLRLHGSQAGDLILVTTPVGGETRWGATTTGSRWHAAERAQHDAAAGGNGRDGQKWMRLVRPITTYCCICFARFASIGGVKGQHLVTSETTIDTRNTKFVRCALFHATPFHKQLQHQPARSPSCVAVVWGTNYMETFCCVLDEHPQPFLVLRIPSTQ